MNDQEGKASSPLDQPRDVSSTAVVGGRRPYEKPAVIYRAPLEAMASVCAPAPPSKSNPGLCPMGPISS